MGRIDEIARGALRHLEPARKQLLSAWIEATMELPAGVSALPGKVRLWPFQYGIADAMGDPEVERVTVVKPVRVGYTTLLTSTVAGYIVNDPAPILCLLPTEDDCRDYVVSDVEPIFEATSALADVLSDDSDEAGRNTMLARRFAGGSLKIIPARSPRSLRRHNARVLVEDEVDAYEMTKEGPADVIAEKRTMSFPNRKIIKGSTPILEETSAILREYEASDKRVYEVPCPACSEFVEIMWEHITWGKDSEGRHNPASAAFACPHCGVVHPERVKPQMVADGRWRATAPWVEGHAGFRLNALISLHANASWRKLVEEFLKAKDSPELLQIFTNTILGQGWKTGGDEIDEQALLKSAEDWSLEDVPEEVLAITVGVDVQDDRLELTALGWTGEDTGPLTLGERVIDGRYDDPGTWELLDEFHATKFPHRLGGTIGIDMMAIDAGSGLHMNAVQAYTTPRIRRGIIAIKGEDGFKRPMIERSPHRKGKKPLWIVGSDSVKLHLVDLLRMSLKRIAGLEAGALPIRFSRSIPPHWFDQLASERVVMRYSHGKPVQRFERISGRRAEALDSVVYGIAARQLLSVDWNKRRAQLRVTDPTLPPRAPKARKPREGFLGNTKGFL